MAGNNIKNKEVISLGKKLKFVVFITIVSFFLLIVLSEIYLAIFNPQPYLFPRLSYSEKYRKIPPENVTMEHCNPPHKRFYSINQYNLRGNTIPISNKYDKPNIVLLGDSYTFGIGVNDGYEYAAILANLLKSEFNIINAAGSGWGLTQQIRRFYEFGQLYQPQIVILLFCENDPDDNLRDKCLEIENSRFVFLDFNKKDNLTLYRLNKYLSRSFIQKSNLYMAMTNIIWPLIQKEQTKINYKREGIKSKTKNDMPLNEIFYNELINLFASDLKGRGIEFYYMSVNQHNEEGKIYEFDQFPYIKENINILDKKGLLNFIDINEWFTKDDFIESPVGHYDVKWNKVLGENLAKYILINTTIEQKNKPQ